MSEPTVLFDTRGAVALVTLNRPQALNSFTRAMHHDLWAALDRIEADTLDPRRGHHRRGPRLLRRRRSRASSTSPRARTWSSGPTRGRSSTRRSIPPCAS